MAVAPDTIDAKSQVYCAGASGTSAETHTTTKTETLAKNSRTPKDKASNIDSRSEVYRLRSQGISAETPTTPPPVTVVKNSMTPKEKAVQIDSKSEVYRLRSPETSAENVMTTPSEEAIKIDSKSEVYRLRSPGTSAGTPTNPKEKALRFPGSVAKISGIPKGKAIKFDSKSEVYRLTSPGTSTEIPTTPKGKALRSPGTSTETPTTPKVKALRFPGTFEAETSTTPKGKSLRCLGTSAGTPTTPQEKALRSPGTVTKNSRTLKEKSIDIDSKSEVSLRSPETSAETSTTLKKALRSPVAVAKNSKATKEKVTSVDKNSEICRLRSLGTSAETPTTPKEKALKSPGAVAKISRTPKENATSNDKKSEVSPGNSVVSSATPKVEASKIRSWNNSSRIKRIDAPETILSKIDHRAKPLNNKEECRSCDPISSMVSVNTVYDDQLGLELAIDKKYEETLLELDLLPEGFSPQKQIFSHPVASMKKSQSTANSDGLFHTIDGSRFSPIEEAALILNTSNGTPHVSSVNVIDKEAEVMHRFGDIDYLFDSRSIRDTLQREFENEDEEREHVYTDSILPLQLIARQSNYRPVYQNPFETPIWQRTTWEETDIEVEFDYKCFTCPSEDILSSDSELSFCGPPVLENDYMEKLIYFQKCQASDRISSSFSVTPGLEEVELGKVNSNGPNSHIFELELAASAEEFVDSDISLIHNNLSGHDHGHGLPRCLHYADERDSDCTLEKSPLNLDVILKQNDELEDNSNQQDPLYWPLNPDSYWHIEGYWDNYGFICK